jgi:hypothetical protein
MPQVGFESNNIIEVVMARALEFAGGRDVW